MKVSDYVADFVASLNTRVYGVSGGMAMYLNDSLVHHPDIKFVATHHEQAAAFAAEADARITNRMAIVHCTAGPGVTNTMTGVASAWADSIPMMVIAGQVERRTLRGGNINSLVRQLGISEIDGQAIMKPITKYAVTVTNPHRVRYILEEAHHLSMSGRKGPVFIEIPIDVQSADVDPDTMECFDPLPKAEVSFAWPDLTDDVAECIDRLMKARRPVCIVGNGIHLAGAEEEFARFLRTNVPILCSWSGADLINSNHPLYIGRPGLIGDRAGNLAIQNADFVLAIGTRLSIPQIGHHPDLFAPNAELVMVDVDVNEITKKTLRPVLGIADDAKAFLAEFNSVMKSRAISGDVARWRVKCREWKYAYPVILPEYDKEEEDGLNAYYFLGELAKNIQDDAIIVTDVGTSFVCTMQAMPMTGRQRMFHNPGIASMGFGLPAAIGASMASGGRQVICLTGDGGTMFNLQELQTIVTHKLPVTIFLYENNGYKTMQTTQNNHFGRESVASPKSGMGWPDFNKLADAFGMESVEIHNNGHLHDFFETRRSGPVLCKVRLSKNNQVMPLVKSKIENGEFIPVGIEDMWPYLPREEFEENMKQRSSDDVERFDEFGACVG